MLLILIVDLDTVCRGAAHCLTVGFLAVAATPNSPHAMRKRGVEADATELVIRIDSWGGPRWFVMSAAAGKETRNLLIQVYTARS